MAEGFDRDDNPFHPTKIAVTVAAATVARSKRFRRFMAGPHTSPHWPNEDSGTSQSGGSSLISILRTSTTVAAAS